jgi:hypothetical protein
MSLRGSAPAVGKEGDAALGQHLGTS